MADEVVLKFFAGGFAFALIITVGLLIRYLWRKISYLWRNFTDPQAAERLGSRVRSSIDGAANAAGQATSTIETIAKSAAKSFADGRREPNRDNPDDKTAP